MILRLRIVIEPLEVSARHLAHGILLDVLVLLLVRQLPRIRRLVEYVRRGTARLRQDQYRPAFDERLPNRLERAQPSVERDHDHRRRAHHLA